MEEVGAEARGFWNEAHAMCHPSVHYAKKPRFKKGDVKMSDESEKRSPLLLTAVFVGDDTVPTGYDYIRVDVKSTFTVNVEGDSAPLTETPNMEVITVTKYGHGERTETREEAVKANIALSRYRQKTVSIRAPAAVKPLSHGFALWEFAYVVVFDDESEIKPIESITSRYVLVSPGGKLSFLMSPHLNEAIVEAVDLISQYVAKSNTTPIASTTGRVPPA